MRVLVTGANGFVGSSLCGMLANAGHVVRAATRVRQERAPSAAEHVVIGDIGPETDWGRALEGVDAVVHSAARAHVLNDHPGNASLYLSINTQGTRKLAVDALHGGVRRLIFLSSVKVNGERSENGAFTANDVPAPADPYAESKWLAEQALWEISSQSQMRVDVVRSPLVYGPGVRANFLRLMQWVEHGLPLPLGAIDNRRSLISIWNLGSVICHLLENEGGGRGTWMISDGEDLSTPQLIRLMALAMGRPARLLSVPPALLRVVGSLAGRRAEIERLCESLAVDISPLRRDGWSAPVTPSEGIARTVESYLAEKNTERAA